MTKAEKFFLIAGVLLAVLIVLCQLCPGGGEWYALKVYPVLSGALSFVSSPVGWSMQGVFIVILILIGILTLCFAKKAKLLKLVSLVVWVFVWFYGGWCLNYSRMPLVERVGAERSVYDSTAFAEFANGFVEELNAAYVADCDMEQAAMTEAVRAFYASVPESYGLCKPHDWQRPKRMLVRRYYSAVGVSGYIGPLFAETHLNDDMPVAQRPFVCAHEFSHLLGVSSEAEANFWGFQACSSSDLPAMRYSGYLTLFSYVASNARGVMPDEDYRAWFGSVRPEVLEDLRESQEIWQSLRVRRLDKIQGFIYDLFLKTNKIPSGMANYSEVVGLLMDVKYP